MRMAFLHMPRAWIPARPYPKSGTVAMSIIPIGDVPHSAAALSRWVLLGSTPSRCRGLFFSAALHIDLRACACVRPAKTPWIVMVLCSNAQMLKFDGQFVTMLL
jgi:hypothetical protein